MGDWICRSRFLLGFCRLHSANVPPSFPRKRESRGSRTAFTRPRIPIITDTITAQGLSWSPVSSTRTMTGFFLGGARITLRARFAQDSRFRGNDGMERGNDGMERGNDGMERGNDGMERGNDGMERGNDGMERTGIPRGATRGRRAPTRILFKEKSAKRNPQKPIRAKHRCGLRAALTPLSSLPSLPI